MQEHVRMTHVKRSFKNLRESWQDISKNNARKGVMHNEEISLKNHEIFPGNFIWAAVHSNVAIAHCWRIRLKVS